MKPMLLSLLTLALLGGCKKEEEYPSDKNKTCPTKCTVVSMPVTFSASYLPEDIDTVVVKKFYPDGSFSQVEEEKVYTLSDTIYYFESSSNHLGPGFEQLRLDGQHDYEIAIPATAQTFRIWDVVEPEDYGYFGCDGKPYTCGVAVKDFSISGGDHELLQYATVPAYLQLKK